MIDAPPTPPALHSPQRLMIRSQSSLTSPHLDRLTFVSSRLNSLLARSCRVKLFSDVFYLSNPNLRQDKIVMDVCGVGASLMGRPYFWPFFSGAKKRKFYNGANGHFFICRTVRNLPMASPSQPYIKAVKKFTWRIYALSERLLVVIFFTFLLVLFKIKIVILFLLARCWVCI